LTSLSGAVEQILTAQRKTRKPLAIVVAGHNGSGKSTMWRKSLSSQVRIPLVNADRMMMAVLPEPGSDGELVEWARLLRDTDEGWMKVAREGVQAFVGHAMQAKVPFAFETVFSYWEPQPDGSVLSKLDLISDMQKAGYFVLLIFVGLTDVDLSVLRVQSRIAENGHAVPPDRLLTRFPRTQQAINAAIKIADAAILTDNSRDEKLAFTVCQVQLGDRRLFDIRDGGGRVSSLITKWLNVVSPPNQPAANNA